MYHGVFPLPVSGWGSSLEFSTNITVGKNAQESRNANWQDALRGFNAISSVRTINDANALFSFFQQVRGQFQSFLVKDYADYQSRNNVGTVGFENVSGIQPANGVRKDFQLVRIYFSTETEGAAPNTTYEIRKITNPKRGTVQVRLNGNILPSGYTVNYDTGAVTFGSAPAAGATIEFKFEFFVPARFATDKLDLQMLYYWVDSVQGERGGIQFPEIPLREVRV